MVIALYSADPELQALCHEVARLIPGAKCAIRQKVDGSPDRQHEISIYDTGLMPLEDMSDVTHVDNGILLVKRNDLPHVRKNIVHLKSIVLVKPVSRSRLEVAIEQRMRHLPCEAGSDLMRLNSDELLECLLQANLRLEELDQERAHFLARAVHELRAPLTSLNGYCGLLLDKKIGPLSSDQIAVLTRMKRSVTRLARIVSTIFDLSVGRSSECTPQYQVGNIVVCLEQALHEIAPMMDDRRLELDIDISGPAAPLRFDAQQMEEVFLNVLDNSCKYSRRGGMVKVRGYPYFWERRSPYSSPVHHCERRRSVALSIPNSYRIDIADDGPGIPPDRLDRTFAESSVYGAGNDRSGAGLGLAISKMIVKQHSGRIWAESKNSEGALFCIVLPHFLDGG